MNDLRKAAEMALEFVEWLCSDDHSVKPKNNALKTREALRQALDDKPPVKSYAGGKPNYCTPQPEVCCGEYARCLKVCIPKERWFAQQKLNVDAVNMSEERVDETAKSKHKWVGLTDDEIREFADKHLFYQPEGYEVSGVFALARAIEAKLKEKNS